MDELSPVQRSEAARERKAALHAQALLHLEKARAVRKKLKDLGFGRYDGRKMRWKKNKEKAAGRDTNQTF